MSDTAHQSPATPPEGGGPDTPAPGHEEYQRLVAEHQQALGAREARLAEQEAAIQALHTTLDTRTAERDQAQRGLLAAHRRALLAEHRGAVIEDLVQGDSVEALEASVARAREAHARVADQLRAEAAAAVPAGNPPRAQPSAEGLSPQAKIAEALRQR